MEALLRLYREHQAVSTAMSLLNWDQQVLMPSGASQARAAHLGRLKRIAHEILVSDTMHRLLEEAGREAEPGSEEAATVRVLAREVATAGRLPVALVERKSRVSAEPYEAWKQAKADSHFPTLRPHLEELFEIARETSDHLGGGEHVYDPLIDLYEEGSSYGEARSMFDSMREPLVELIGEIRTEGRQVDDRRMVGNWDPARLRKVAEQIAAHIGFDFGRGRLDVARNAFCSTASCGDVRMTTRPSEHLKGILSSSLHEMGHGLYEQGSPPAWDRTPLAGGASLAVHESQSRLWENILGRSRGFWTFFLPTLQAEFPELDSLSVDDFWRAYGHVSPTYIRVGADELTYNLHILVRFELEVEILTGQTAVRDLPEAWNAKYEEYLGIRPRNDAEGCLQDVHWSKGSVGYFPTYSMGNLIGGMLFERMSEDLGDLDERMAVGDFASILGWLQDRIYSQASLHPPKELVARVTGSPMAVEPWLRYARSKFGRMYELPERTAV
jgi:carboxypeptidase Taq